MGRVISVLDRRSFGGNPELLSSVYLSKTEGFSCFNATETRVREITRHRVKQIILSIIHSLLVTLAVAWERRTFPPLSIVGKVSYVGVDT